MFDSPFFTDVCVNNDMNLTRIDAKTNKISTVCLSVYPSVNLCYKPVIPLFTATSVNNDISPTGLDTSNHIFLSVCLSVYLSVLTVPFLTATSVNDDITPTGIDALNHVGLTIFLSVCLSICQSVLHAHSSVPYHCWCQRRHYSNWD